MTTAAKRMSPLARFTLTTFLLGAAGGAMPADAAAETYYVATSGSDANSCTQAQSVSSPRRTIGAGLTCLRAGDTLFVRRGTYSENIDSNSRLIPTGSSWNDAPKVAAYPGETVSLGYLNLAAPSRMGQASIQYVIFDGLTFVNPTSTNDTVAFWGAVHHVRIQSADVSGAKNAHSGINTKPGNGGGGYIEILNTKIHHNGDCSISCSSGTVGHGLYISTNNNLFDRIESYSNGHLGMQIYSGDALPSNNTIRNSTFHHNQTAYKTSGRGLSVGVGSNNLVYNNVIYANLGGIQIGYGGSGTQVYNNTIVDNGGDGIVVDSTSRSAIVQNNIVYNNSGRPIVDSGSSTRVSSNLTVDPKFVNPTARDYSLSSGSPAIDVGLAISVVATDIVGVRRPQGGAYDLGAHEHGGTALSPPAAPTNVRILP